MIFKLQAKGHKNVTSHHKSTFEITKDPEIGPTADCIIGTGADKSMLDFPSSDRYCMSNQRLHLLKDIDD